jgi:phenylalanyl-tRNA synthetase beta subunit
MDFVPPSDDPTHRRLRDALVGAGLLETISYAFTGEAELAAARASPATVRSRSRKGTERAVMRTALYPGLLSAARLNHAAPDLALFEVGRVFGDEERERLALLLRGERLGATWRAGRAGRLLRRSRACSSSSRKGSARRSRSSPRRSRTCTPASAPSGHMGRSRRRQHGARAP